MLFKSFIISLYIYNKRYRIRRKQLLVLFSLMINKLIAEQPQKREKIKAQVQFRHDLLESQKRVNYNNEFDRLQGAKKLPGLDANTKPRMKELRKKQGNH